MKSFFPITLMILDFGASITYLAYGDKPRALYWFSAGMITLSTLFIK